METEILLDTHVIVWLHEGARGRFSEKTHQILNESALLVSPISLLELDYLRESRKIAFDGAAIYNYLVPRVNLRVAEDSFFQIVCKASGLHWTRDPFDRLLVAHARLRDCSLITKDRQIRKHYSKSVW